MWGARARLRSAGLYTAGVLLAVFCNVALAITGTNGNDNATGTAGNDTFYMKDGRDLATGLEGADTLFMGKGIDAARGSNGWDYVDGQDGWDDLYNFGVLGLRGGNGNDTVKGGEGKDLVIGGTGSNELRGGNGADDVDGGGNIPAERDRIIGGNAPGDDCIYSAWFSNGAGTNDYDFSGCENLFFVVYTNV